MKVFESVSCSVVSNSLRPHGLEPTRLLCPWDSPGKNAGVGAIPFSRGSSWPRDRTWLSWRQDPNQAYRAFVEHLLSTCGFGVFLQVSQWRNFRNWRWFNGEEGKGFFTQRITGSLQASGCPWVTRSLGVSFLTACQCWRLWERGVFVSVALHLGSSSGLNLKPQTQCAFCMFMCIHLSFCSYRTNERSVQFICSVMSDSLRPHESQHARPPCPSPTPRVYSDSCPLIYLVMRTSHLILCHPLLLLPCFSRHQGLFHWVVSSHLVYKVLELQHQSFQWIFKTDLLQDWLVGSPCSSRGSQESSPTPQFRSINSLALGFLYGPTLTSIHEYWKNKRRGGRPNSHHPVSGNIGHYSWVAFALFLIRRRKCPGLGDWIVTSQKLKPPCSSSSGNVKML